MAFAAQHPGTCAACDGWYEAGTPIRQRGGRYDLVTPDIDPPGWGHSVCPDPLGVDHPPCPDCFLVHPPGTCDR